MDKSKRTLWVAAIAALLALTVAPAASAAMEATKPIATASPGPDRSAARVTAAEIEKVRQKVIIVNQPGASGRSARRTRSRPRRTVTQAAGAAQDPHQRFRYRHEDHDCSSSTLPTFDAVRESEHAVQDAHELIDAMKAKPGDQRRDGRRQPAGQRDGGHAKATGASKKHVTYDGGGRSSDIAGETDATSQPPSSRPR
jgi:tripartite-type tricarboxylate transporter receptor subunit TctC